MWKSASNTMFGLCLAWQRGLGAGRRLAASAIAGGALLLVSLQAYAANGALFVSNNVPTTMTAGEKYTVTIAMKNNGTTSWTVAGGFMLGSQSPQGNTTWGPSTVALGTTYAVNAQKLFSIAVIAPSQPGTYNFQWQMMQSGVPFGDATPNVAVNVVAPVYDAQFVSQGAATAVAAATNRTFSVTMKNTGNTTWSATDPVLAPIGAAAGWAVVTAPVGATVSPGGQRTFSLTLKAPAELAFYDMQWQLRRQSGAFFGEPSDTLRIGVMGAAPAVTLVSPTAGQVFVAAQSKIKIPVYATAVPTGVATITKMQLMYYSGTAFIEVESVDGGVFDQTVEYYPSNGTIYMRATDSFNKYTQVSVNVKSIVDNSQFIAQTVPAKMIPGRQYDVSFTLKNSGGTTWYPATHSLAPYYVADKDLWGVSSFPLDSEVPPGGTGTFSGTVTAPTTANSYRFYWKMTEATRGAFGATTTNVSVAVARPLPVVTMTAPVDNETYTLPAGENAVVTVQGSAVLAEGATMRTLEVVDGSTVIHTVETDSINTTLVLAPGNHPLKLRATDNWGIIGLSTVADVIVKGNGAAYVSQSVPSSLIAGQTFTATVTMKNTGSTNWAPLSAANPQGYALASQNPQDNSAWRLRATAGGTALPTQTANFSVGGTAPSTPGVYNFQWQMLQEGREYFGSITPAVQVTVKPPLPVATLSSPVTAAKFTSTAGKADVAFSGSGTAGAGGQIVLVELLDSATVLQTAEADQIEGTVQLATGSHSLRIRTTDNFGQVAYSAYSTITVQANGSTFYSKTVPTTMVAGKTYTVVVAMRNTGSPVWTAEDGYQLGVQPENSETWGRTSVPLAAPVVYNGLATFTFTVVAPATPGTYPFQWQMQREGYEWFGAKSTVQNVVVTAELPTATLASPTANASYPGIGLAGIVRLQGSGQAFNGATVAKLEVLDGTTVIATVEADSIDTSIPMAFGTHSITLRTTDSRGTIGVSAAAPITILRHHATFVSQSVPTGMVAGDRYSVSVTMRNTGSSTWQPYAPPQGVAGLGIAALAAPIGTATGFTLASRNPADNTIWGTDRVPLTTTVAPNALATFTFDVIAPQNAGTQNFQWQVVDEALGVFGFASANLEIAVSPPVLPVATMTATPTMSRIQTGQIATITLVGSGTVATGEVRKMEVFRDSGNGFGSSPVLSFEGAAATLPLNDKIPLSHGIYRLKLRATDAAGRYGESAPVTVSVADERLTGAVVGIRILAGQPRLTSWIMMDPAGPAVVVNYYVKAPSAFGGIKFGTAVVGSATPGQGGGTLIRREFDYGADDLNTMYPGEPVYVEVIPVSGGDPVVLPNENGNTIMPGTLRVGLTSPSASNDDHTRNPSPVFLRAVVSGATGAIDEVTFNVEGDWMPGVSEGGGTYSVQKTGLAARVAAYKTYAKAKQGDVTLLTEERLFYVDGANSVSLLSPVSGAKLTAGTAVKLSAQPSGDVSAVQAVTFYVNGQVAGTGVNNAGNWSYSWTPRMGGNTAIYARSYDGNGVLLSQSPTANVSVESTSIPPTLQPIAEEPPHINNPDAGTLPGSVDVRNDGAAIYSMALVVPPGTAGLQPNLSLNYSSKSGNGLAGLGWSLGGLSSIQRCAKTIAQDGIADRISFSTSDRLCLDGQRLIRISGAPASDMQDDDDKYWASDAEFRMELDNFTRITRVLGGSVFKVEPKSGLVHYYGHLTSKIQAQGRSDGAVLEWALGKTQDRSGNYMEIDYSVNADTGEYMPRQMRYGGYQQNSATPDPAKTLATDLSVRFQYEDRSDAQIRYVGGSRSDLRKRLAHIGTYIGTAADGSGGTLVRDYELHYSTSPSSGRSLIDWVQVCAKGATAAECVKLPKTNFSWGQDSGVTMRITERTPRSLLGSKDRPAKTYLADIDGSGTTTYLVPTPGPQVDAACELYICKEYTLANKIAAYTAQDQSFLIELQGYNGKGTFTAMKTGDLDGDGREDLIFMDLAHGKWIYCLSVSEANGLRDFAECQPGGSFLRSEGEPPYRMPMVITRKRDGRDHVVTPFPEIGPAQDCSLMNGAITCQNVTTKSGQIPSDMIWYGAGVMQRMQPIGLSRRGILDLFAVWNEGGEENIPNAGDITRMGVCTGGINGFSCWTTDAPGSLAEQPAPVSGDLNGDGLTDFAFGKYICLSTETLVDCNSILSTVPVSGGNVLAAGIQDWLGDGFRHFYGGSDIAGKEQLCHMENGSVVCRSIAIDSASEAAWNKITKRISSNLDLRNARVFYANADGLPSSLVCNTVEDSEPEQCWVVTISGSPHLDKITSIKNGLGNNSEVEYARADNAGVYSAVATISGTARKPAYPQQSFIPGAIVKELRRDTGMGHFQTNSYHYEGGQYDAYGRGALGFALVRVTDGQTQINTETVLSQEFPFLGMAQRSRTYNSTCTLSDTSYELDKKTPVTLGESRTYFPFVKNASTTRKDLNCSALGNAHIANQYDAFGNIKTQTTTTTGDGMTFTSVADTEYVSEVVENAHLIGLPKKVTLTRTATGTNAITRTVAYSYDPGTGLRTSETIEPGNPKFQVVTSYDRSGNGYGLVNAVTQAWADPACPSGTAGCVTAKSRTVSTVDYQSNGRFPSTVANALNQSETYTYDAATGAKTSITGPNGLHTSWTIDGFGTVTKETRADGNSTKTYYKQCSATLCPQKPDAAVLQITEQFHGAARIAVPQMLYTDNVGQPMRSQTRGFDGNWDYVERVYDAQGRLDWIGQPVDYSVQHPPIAARQRYDDLNRLTKLVKLDDNGAEIVYTTSYEGYTRTLSNPRKLSNGQAQSRTEKRDVLGQLREVTDALNGKVSYEYDAFGNLIKTTDPSGNEIVITYDDLGRKIRLNDPNLGEIKYELDPLGQLLAQTSPEQALAKKKTTFEYDELGRMKARYEPDLNSYWVYDKAVNGIGKLSETYTGKPELKDYRRVHKYDTLGRPSTSTQTISGVDYSSTLEYDDWSRVITQTHQRGSDDSGKKQFELRYNGMGYLSRIQRAGDLLWQVSSQDAANRLTEIALGNGLKQTYEYFEGSGRLKAAALVAGDARRLEEGYLYDEIGNVKERTQFWDSEGFTELFTYDNLNRLASSKIGDELQNFTYFADGRIKRKDGIGTGDYVYPQPGAGVVRPHAVTSIPGVTGTFSYDLNGNRITGNGYEIGWTSFDMPTTIKRNGKSSSFIYGSEHQRTIQTRNDGTTIVYAGAQEVETVTEGGSISTKVKTYWPNGVGVEIDKAGETTLYWTHADRLGSVVAMTRLDGNLEEKLAYDAWGKRRLLTSQSAPDGLKGRVDNQGFTGHEMLDTLDLIHMNGRVYDPSVAQFLSGDPLISDPTDGQNYNRYSYVLNNPTNLVDPTGFQTVKPPDTPLPVVEVKEELTKNGNIMSSFTFSMAIALDSQMVTVKLTGRFGPQNGVLPSSRFGAASSGLDVGRRAWTTVADHLEDSWSAAKSSLVYHLENPLDIIDDTLAPFGGASGPRALLGLGFAAAKTVQSTSLAGQAINACCCFPAGTPVATENGMIPIEKIHLGQLVYARDPETGDTELKPVTQLMITHAKPLFKLVTEGKFGLRESMEVTGNHPYWVIGTGWIDAEQLYPGMMLQSLHRDKLIVVSIEKIGRDEVTYNFTVADFHTYFAGSQKAFVHNCSCLTNVAALAKGVANAERKLWEVSKAGTERVVKSERFGKFYKSASDGLWWSKDQAGHGDSQWKVFRENSKGLEWFKDADQYGTFIEGKHKGPTGVFIPWDKLNSVGF